MSHVSRSHDGGSGSGHGNSNTSSPPLIPQPAPQHSSHPNRLPTPFQMQQQAMQPLQPRAAGPYTAAPALPPSLGTSRQSSEPSQGGGHVGGHNAGHGLSIAIPGGSHNAGGLSRRATGDVGVSASARGAANGGGAGGCGLSNYQSHHQPQQGAPAQQLQRAGGQQGSASCLHGVGGGLERVREDGGGEYYRGDGGYGGGVGAGYARRDQSAHSGMGACGGSGRDSGSLEQRQTATGVSWSIKPVCADRTKRSAMPMRKSWHAHMHGGSEEGAGADGARSTAPIPAPPPPGRHPLSPSRHSHDAVPAAAPSAHPRLSHEPSQREAQQRSERRLSTERVSIGGSGGSHTDLAPPHTPPTNGSGGSLWAKRRGPSEASPSNLPENLRLVSLKGGQWDELQSPLDAFAHKHCPVRSRHTSSSVATGNSDGSNPRAGLPRFSIDTDDDLGPVSPSWDRASNHSPLAALLRREFPSQEGAKPNRLFDDL